MTAQNNNNKKNPFDLIASKRGMRYVQMHICFITSARVTFIQHSHEDRPFIDKEFNGGQVSKDHIDDKEEECSTPVVDADGHEVIRIVKDPPGERLSCRMSA